MAGLFGTQQTAASSSSTTGDTSKDVDITQQRRAGDPRPEDSISDLSFSPNGPNRLAIASWDKFVYIYDIDTSNVGQLAVVHSKVQCKGHVLCVAFSPDGLTVAAGDTEGHLNVIDLNSMKGECIAPSFQAHEAAIKCVRWATVNGMTFCATGSWDKTVKYWSNSPQWSPEPIGKVQCAERVYTMDVKNNLLVVGLAERSIIMVDLTNPNVTAKTITSPLKWQTRVVSCFADATGFAVGSIEGRCAIQYVDDKESSLNFSFKCHRQQDPNARDIAKVYSVNAISFHPIHGTFSTAGSDGTFHFWDKDAKHRLKGYPEVGGSITATGFNRDGSIFAYAVSYDWSKGYAANRPDYPIMIKLHPIIGDECKPRPGTRKK